MPRHLLRGVHRGDRGQPRAGGWIHEDAGEAVARDERAFGDRGRRKARVSRADEGRRAIRAQSGGGRALLDHAVVTRLFAELRRRVMGLSKPRAKLPAPPDGGRSTGIAVIGTDCVPSSGAGSELLPNGKGSFTNGGQW